MTDNDIKTISEKIESLHKKILESKFAEKVAESEMMSLILAVQTINSQKAEIERLKEYETALKKGCALSRCINKGFVQDEAYKEFFELVQAKSYEEHGFLEVVDLQDIETIFEELTEGGNEDGTNHS